MVTRDPAVTDRDRVDMSALAAYERHVHSACGYHASQIDDPDAHPMTPDSLTCPFCAANARQSRLWEAEDRQLEKRFGKPEPGRPYPTDGVTRFLRPATPEEIEKARTRREGGEQ